MLTINLILLIAALVCFGIAAFLGISKRAARIDLVGLTALGLFFFVLVSLIGTINRM